MLAALSLVGRLYLRSIPLACTKPPDPAVVAAALVAAGEADIAAAASQVIPHIDETAEEAEDPDAPEYSWRWLVPNSVVVVAVKEPAFLWRFDHGSYHSYRIARVVRGCRFKGKHLPCRWVQIAEEEDAVGWGADAVVWNAPSTCWVPDRPPCGSHLRVVASTESSIYYNCLDSPAFMAQFDMEMTYRSCSQVPLHFFVDKYTRLDATGLLRPPVPFGLKRDAIAWLSRNCQADGAFSGRTNIMRGVRAAAARLGGRVQVMSYGGCEQTHNMTTVDKIGLFAQHKFCVAMENSITQDYVTEKLWDALMAGCVPVYLGAPNIDDFLPHPDAAIVYGRGAIQTPEDLVAELERLAGDRAAYERHLAWKHFTREEDFSPQFRAFLRQSELYLPHVQCRLCQEVASHRLRPGKRTTCLWNRTWLHRAGRLHPDEFS